MSRETGAITAPPAAGTNGVSIIGPFPTSPTVLPKHCNGLTSDVIVALNVAKTCLPRSFISDPVAFFSPGTGCPRGYTAPPSCTRSTDSITTTITCCPNNGGFEMSCVEDPATLSGPWEPMFCTWSAGSKETVVLVTSEDAGTTITSAVTWSGADGANAYGLRMLYEATDLTASATATSATATDTSTTFQGGSSSSSSSSSTGLSLGAKIAIGVVIPLVLIAALIGVLLWRRRKRRGPAASEIGASDGHADTKNEHHSGEPYGNQSYPQELSTGPEATEMPANERVTRHEAMDQSYTTGPAQPSPHKAHASPPATGAAH